jgi:hypothetical protein
VEKSWDQHRDSIKHVVSTNSLSIQKSILVFRRQRLIDLHKNGTFSQATIRLLEQELDHDEQTFNRQKSKK